MSFPLINVAQFFDSSGAPLASGTLEFRDPTSNAYIDTFPTADDADAQTDANDNPLTLNARGEAATGIYLEDGVKYKIILKDSEGATIWTQDDVLCPIGLPYLQTAAESAAGVTPTNVEYPPGNVKRYGATGDGVTDDTQSFIDALAAAPNGSEILIPESDTAYRITTGNIDLPTTKAVHIRGADAKIEHNSTTNTDYVFGIDFGTSATAPQSQISGIRFTTVTNGNGIAIRIYGTNHQTFRDIFAIGFDKVFAIRNDAVTTWSEALHFENIDLRGNNYGFHYSVGSGNASFATQFYSHVRIALVGAAAAVPYGFYLATSADIYRSRFDNMTIFPAINDGVGFYCDGKMRNCTGSINIEGNTVGITGNTGIELDTNASLIHVDINSDIRGVIANDFTVTTTEAISGWKTSSLSNVEATIVKSSKLAGIRAVVEEDLATFNMIEKVTAAGVYQWLTLAATPPEFVDSSTGNLSPVRLLDVGNAEATAADGDLTPTVADTTRLLLSQTSGIATITDFDDGIDGQMLVVRFIQSTHASTIDHNVNIVLNGGVDYTPTNDHSTLTLMNYGGTVWREISRMET